MMEDISSAKLYKADMSPPARAAMMACDLFEVPVKMIDVNLGEKEQLKSEFLKKNPVHTIPVLEDGELTIHDSHAILMYLADRYGKNDDWYPKDIQKRTLVNQKLFFDTAILFPRLRNTAYPILRLGVKTVTEQQYADINEAYSFLENFLSHSKFLATDDVTIADISAFSTITSLKSFVPLEKYPQTKAWVKTMETYPFSKKFNTPGATEFSKLLKNLLE